MAIDSELVLAITLTVLGALLGALGTGGRGAKREALKFWGFLITVGGWAIAFLSGGLVGLLIIFIGWYIVLNVATRLIDKKYGGIAYEKMLEENENARKEREKLLKREVD